MLVPQLGDDVDHNPTRKRGILPEESSVAHAANGISGILQSRLSPSCGTRLVETNKWNVSHEPHHLHPPQTKFGEGQPAIAWLGRGNRIMRHHQTNFPLAVVHQATSLD
jgi:hypothetical protein